MRLDRNLQRHRNNGLSRFRIHVNLSIRNKV